MAFRDFPEQQQGVELLQRSLGRGRLAHAYLFSGNRLELLEGLARTLAKTVNCEEPLRKGTQAIDCCDRCLACKKIEHGNHADVHWVRPESKTRIIRVEQIRDLIQEVNLKPTEARFKMGIIVAADRLKTEAANAFLKTLEEPPAKSMLLLLTTEPQRIIETMVSRCLRLNFGGEGARRLPPDQMEWLVSFTQLAAAGQKSLLGRYRLMDLLLRKLNATRDAIDESLTARSPLQQYKDADEALVEKWEDELAAGIEAEYRRQRGDLLTVLQSWLRDVWLETLNAGTATTKSQLRSSKGAAGESVDDGQSSLLSFPQLEATQAVARRISAGEAAQNLQVLEQLQRWLFTNVQEALALEVGLLKLRL